MKVRAFQITGLFYFSFTLMVVLLHCGRQINEWNWILKISSIWYYPFITHELWASFITLAIPQESPFMQCAPKPTVLLYQSFTLRRPVQQTDSAIICNSIKCLMNREFEVCHAMYRTIQKTPSQAVKYFKTSVLKHSIDSKPSVQRTDKPIILISMPQRHPGELYC